MDFLFTGNSNLLTSVRIIGMSNQIDRVTTKDIFRPTLIARPDFVEGELRKGFWNVRCLDPDGNVKWDDVIENIVVNEGLDYALDTSLSGGAQITSWFVGLVDNSNFTAFAAGDTAAGITLDATGANGWQELDDYSEAARQAWTDGGVSGQSVDNSASVAAFSINATVVIHGAFLVSVSTIGGATGTLYAEGAFTGGNKNADNGDTLEVTATFTSSSA